jgi:hypothetical protein
MLIRIRRAHARKNLIGDVPARPLSAWAGPPGSIQGGNRDSRMMAGGNPSRQSLRPGFPTGTGRSDSSGSDVGYSPLMFQQGNESYGQVNSSGEKRTSIYGDGIHQNDLYSPANGRHLPLPAATLAAAHSEDPVFQRVQRSPSPSRSYQAQSNQYERPASPSAYYSQRRSSHKNEYDNVPLHYAQAAVYEDNGVEFLDNSEQDLGAMSTRNQNRQSRIIYDAPQQTSEDAYQPHRLSTVQEKRQSGMYSYESHRQSVYSAEDDVNYSDPSKRYSEKRISFIPVMEQNGMRV